MSERTLRLAAAVLSLAGTGVSAYLTNAHYARVPVACSTGGCETVLRSRYAELAGVPVAALGIAGYVAILACVLFPGEAAAVAAATLSAAGLLFAVYLIVVQVAVLDALCQWCLTSDGVLFLLTLVTVWRARVQLAGRSSLS